MRLLSVILAACLTLSAVADEPAPELLTAEPTDQAAGIEVAFGDAPARDWQWHGDVEEALRYLYKRQNNILERLAKVEAAQIRVQTPQGTVNREVPVRSGTGYFNLAPGETLVGYQDPVTGQWVNVQQNQPTVVRYPNLERPVAVYNSAPSVEVRTVQPASRYQPVQGRVRVRMGSCANGQCR